MKVDDPLRLLSTGSNSSLESSSGSPGSDKYVEKQVDQVVGVFRERSSSSSSGTSSSFLGKAQQIAKASLSCCLVVIQAVGKCISGAGDACVPFVEPHYMRSED